MNKSKGIRPEMGRKEISSMHLRSMAAVCTCGAIIMALIIGVAGSRVAAADPKAGSDTVAKAADKTLDDIRDEKAKSKQERFQVLFDRAKDHYKAARYGQALVEVEEAIKIYPDDKKAQYLRKKILIDSNKSRDDLLKSAADAGADDVMAGMDKDRIVPGNILTYPTADNWRRVVSRAAKLSKTPGVRGSIVEDWEKALKTKLDRRISFSFENATLAEVARYLQDVTNVTIVIDPKAPIAKTPISLMADDVKLESALNQVCRFAEVKWSMADKMIYISDRKVSDEPQLATYNVTDLLLPVRDFHADGKPELTGRSLTKPGDMQVSVGFAEQDASSAARDAHGHELIEFIKNNIAPGTWCKEEEAGQGVNTIRYRNGRLVVSHNSKVHQEILKLLESFRRARTVQIVVLARFIEIEKNYLEEIGIDWTGLEGGVNTISDRSQWTPVDDSGNLVPISRGGSFRGNDTLDEFGNDWSTGYLDTDTESYQGLPNGYDSVYGSIPDGYGRNPEPTRYWKDLNGDGVTQPNEWFSAKRVGGPFDVGMADVNHLGIALGDSSSGFTSSGGLLLDLAYLNAFQVRVLLDAVQKQRKGNILTSPRLTCFNGERANIAVTAQVNYLRNIVQGTPEIGTITDGMVFEVVPYASADRRYVTMEILPVMRNMTRPIREVTVSVPEYLDDGGVTVTTTIVQLPEVTVKSVETFASVPDGGTLLLGGLSRANEQSGTATIPILGDIPILKYLFSRWGSSDTRTSLIILVRADILIQGEEEPNVGPAS